MKKSDDISALAAALVKAQPQIGIAIKDSLNPHFKSKYADLASIWDACAHALQENDLAVSQLTDQTDTGQPALTTMLIHKSGQWIAATYPLISVKADPQGYASATTYARRYGLASLLGVLADDDDGEAATRPPKPVVKAVSADSTPGQSALADNPKLTPDQWAQTASETIAAFTTIVGLDSWCQKNDRAMVRMIEYHPALAKALSAKIDIRRRELAR